MPKPRRIDVSLLERDRHVAREELRDRFYKLRDLEIQNLWQRTTIFAGFIGLFFTGYGYILVEKLGGIPTPKDCFFHLICCGIAILAIIFSIIWIMMAKGAKAWCEVHERYITELEAEEVLKIPPRYQMGKLPYPGSDNEPDLDIWTTKGGRFSPSRLNIIFGQALLVVWLIILIFHILMLNPFGWTEPESVIYIVIVLTVFELISSCVSYIADRCNIADIVQSGAILDRSSYLKKRQEILLQEFESFEEKVQTVYAGAEITQPPKRSTKQLKVPNEEGNTSQSSQEVSPDEDTIKKDEKALDLLHFLIDRVRNENGFYSVGRGNNSKETQRN